MKKVGNDYLALISLYSLVVICNLVVQVSQKMEGATGFQHTLMSIGMEFVKIESGCFEMVGQTLILRRLTRVNCLATKCVWTGSRFCLGKTGK